MPVVATKGLNFIVYIENIYFNQYQQTNKFPRWPEAIQFIDSFVDEAKRLTTELLRYHDAIDARFIDDKPHYGRLFVNQRQFEDVYRSFLAWFNSPVGRSQLLVTASSMDEAVTVSLIYDDWLTGDWEEPRLKVRTIEALRRKKPLVN